MARITRKRGSRSSDSGVPVGLPIVPMLDMAFQLLFFFVVSFHTQALEGALECGVKAPPDSGGSTKGAEVPERPPASEIEFPDRIRVVLKHSSGDGVAIDSLVVQTNEGDWLLPDLPALGKFLKQRRTGPESSGAVQVAAEGRLKYGRVVEVVDVCRKAGYDKVGIAPPPDA